MPNLCMCHLMIEVLVGHLPTPSSMKCVQPFCGPLVLSPGGEDLDIFRDYVCTYEYHFGLS